MVEFSSTEHETAFNLSGLYANTEYDLVLRQRPPLQTSDEQNNPRSTAPVPIVEHWSPAAVVTAAKTAPSSECSGVLAEGSREATMNRFPLPVYLYLCILCIHVLLQNSNVGLIHSAIWAFK